MLMKELILLKITLINLLWNNYHVLQLVVCHTQIVPSFSYKSSPIVSFSVLIKSHGNELNDVTKVVIHASYTCK